MRPWRTLIAVLTAAKMKKQRFHYLLIYFNVRSVWSLVAVRLSWSWM